MSTDYNSALPVRDKTDADEKLQSKIIDYSTASQGMSVNTDGEAHVRVFGEDPAAADIGLKLSELGNANTDGKYDVSDNTKPSSNGLIAHDRNESPTVAQQIKRVTAKTGAVSTTVTALDVAIRDANAEPFSEVNPLPVYNVDDVPGEEVHDFKDADAIVKDGSDNHDYEVADGETLLLMGVLSSGSGKLKAEVLLGDGGGTEAFVVKAVNFNSTASPEANFDFFKVPLKVVGTANGTNIRVKLTNLDGGPQSLYSTIIGVLKS